MRVLRDEQRLLHRRTVVDVVVQREQTACVLARRHAHRLARVPVHEQRHEHVGVGVVGVVAEREAPSVVRDAPAERVAAAEYEHLAVSEEQHAVVVAAADLQRTLPSEAAR
jgi:hypothetical protein